MSATSPNITSSKKLKQVKTEMRHETIEEKDEEYKESFDEYRNTFMKMPGVNHLATEQQQLKKSEFNDSNILSQQIQLFNQEQADENADRIFDEGKLDQMKASNAEDLIREYEEIKQNLESDMSMSRLSRISRSKDRIDTVIPETKAKANMLFKIRASLDGMGPDMSCAETPKNDEYFNTSMKYPISMYLAIDSGR